MSVLDKFVSKEATLSMPITTYQVLLEQAALEESERIIKMLEEAIGSYGNKGWTIEQNCLRVAIALIKENK